MYKDIITYELADGISEVHLLEIAGQIVTEWMKKLPGFISWEININSDGSYTDIVTWDSKAAAENANQEMANIPNAGDWFACYKEGSIKSKNLNKIASF